MNSLFPTVIETEDSGAVSAYVPGLPVYAAADTRTQARRAIRALLTSYLQSHVDGRPRARGRRRQAQARAKSAR